MKKIKYFFIFLGLFFILMYEFFPKLKTGKMTSSFFAEEIVFPFPKKFFDLNPSQVISSDFKSLGTLVFSRLIRMDKNFNIQPEILTNWEYRPEEKSYILTIKSNISFHDGKMLNIDDLIFSIHQWAKKENLDSDLLLPIDGVKEYREKKRDKITGISKIDHLKVKIRLKKWANDFMLVFSNYRFLIFPNNFNNKTEEIFFNRPIGTGPYHLLRKTANYIHYRRFEEYYLGPSLTKNFVFRYVPIKDAYEQFLDKKISNLIFYDLTSLDLDRVKKDKDLTVELGELNSTFSLYFGLNYKELTKKKRESIAYLIRSQMIKTSCFKNSVLAKSFIPMGFMGHYKKKNIPRLRFSQLKIQNSLNIYIPNQNYYSACIKDGVNTHLSQFNLKIVPLPLEKMFDLFKKKQLPIAMENFTFKNIDPISALQYFRSTSTEYLLVEKVPGLESLFNKISNVSFAEKGKILRNIDDFLVDEKLVIPLFHFFRPIVYHKKIKGLRFTGASEFIINWHKIFLKKD